jgi:hypothetical protein
MEFRPWGSPFQLSWHHHAQGPTSYCFCCGRGLYVLWGPKCYSSCVVRVSTPSNQLPTVLFLTLPGNKYSLPLSSGHFFPGHSICQPHCCADAREVFSLPPLLILSSFFMLSAWQRLARSLKWKSLLGSHVVIPRCGEDSKEYIS